MNNKDEEELNKVSLIFICNFNIALIKIQSKPLNRYIPSIFLS